MNSNKPSEYDPDPGRTDPEQYSIFIDCIIFGYSAGVLNLLTVIPDNDTRGSRPRLMGGSLLDGESLDSAAGRILEKLTGLTDVYLEQFRAFGATERNDGKHTVSIGYYALVDQQMVRRRPLSGYQARWVPVPDSGQVEADYKDMVNLAVSRLRYRSMYEPVAFGLLPERFTLSQLQSLYEAIFATDIDAGNFRRRLRRMDYLRRLDEKDVNSSRRGAWFYSYDPELFEKAVAEGHQFYLKP